jgi:proteasome lid subunit RPN8/RPN11
VTARLIIPNQLRAQILEEARDALPLECCGLIEGTHDGQAIRVHALHAVSNIATAPDRFEIDPAEQFRLVRELRGTGRAIVGCYHSHPNGRAEPSRRDLECAVEDGFIWLIAALNADAVSLRAFVSQQEGFDEISLSQASQC